MRKGKPARVASELHDFLVLQAKEKQTSVRIESKNLFEDYFRLKSMEKKLQNGKVFVIK